MEKIKSLAALASVVGLLLVISASLTVMAQAKSVAGGSPLFKIRAKQALDEPVNITVERLASSTLVAKPMSIGEPEIGVGPRTIDSCERPTIDRTECGDCETRDEYTCEQTCNEEELSCSRTMCGYETCGRSCEQGIPTCYEATCRGRGCTMDCITLEAETCYGQTCDYPTGWVCWPP
jgi:hypothetical protein